MVIYRVVIQKLYEGGNAKKNFKHSVYNEE